MKMNRSTYRIGAAIVASLMVYALVAFFVIRPMWLKNQAQLNQIQERTVDEEVVLLKQQRLPVIRDQVERVRQASGDLAVTASANDPIRWVQDLETLAKDTGNTIAIEIDDTISPKPKLPEKNAATTGAPESSTGSKPAAPVAPVAPTTKIVKKSIRDDIGSTTGQGLRLTIMGDYFSLTAFLKKLELLPYYVDVLSISFSKTDTPSGATPASSSTPRNIFQTTSGGVASTAPSVSNDIRPMQAVLGVVVALPETNQ